MALTDGQTRWWSEGFPIVPKLGFAICLRSSWEKADSTHVEPDTYLVSMEFCESLAISSVVNLLVTLP
jgi:hypothetical protein